MKFKEYNQSQGQLPAYLDDLIEGKHLVRVISKIVDDLDINLLTPCFKASKQNKGGCLPYHPKMMLKVLIYAYSTGTFTSRKIAKQLRENIYFMWLSGRQTPDFRTINRYRGVYFIDVLKHVFPEITAILIEKKLIDMETVFVDGTKINADANKFKVIWNKNVERYKKAIFERSRKILAEIENLEEADKQRYGGFDLPECGEQSQISSEELHEAADQLQSKLAIDGRMSKSEAGQKIRKASRQMKKDAEKLEKYDAQKKILDGQNSRSRTDTDAPVIKTKTDELRPGYNVQVMATNGFIPVTAVTQNANDGTSFVPLMQELSANNLPLPSTVVADAGYGSAEVYNYLERNNIEAVVKYPAYRAERSNEKKYRYHYSKFIYEKERDEFVCPEKKHLVLEKTIQTTAISGFVIESKRYLCHDCKSCPCMSECTKSETGRSLTVNFELRRHQAKARDCLGSPHGIELYRQRGYQVETVFGEIKHNMKFDRFHVRGLAKVKAENLLLIIAYNLKKLARVMPEFALLLTSFLAKIVALYLTYLSSETFSPKVCSFRN